MKDRDLFWEGFTLDMSCCILMMGQTLGEGDFIIFRGHYTGCWQVANTCLPLRDMPDKGGGLTRCSGS